MDCELEGPANGERARSNLPPAVDVSPAHPGPGALPVPEPARGCRANRCPVPMTRWYSHAPRVAAPTAFASAVCASDGFSAALQNWIGMSAGRPKILSL